ncbi:uncharacterized protein LOC105190725 [Harpegnathos saltator]|uniref:Homocysteine S-methyltransferase n=1 Tax=Harpegnathos saltator TaxID=610380 RepID=E2C779_HARSA|nr:uncharacterized protein LOC105190725 [Harpegnathos saltator]EFN76192.1 Homocysteine S-methyltransferase [Harpegnathos saltator]
MNQLLVLDGDFEAQLLRRSKHANEVGKSFMLQVITSEPYSVLQTHMDFLRAGAQLIRTNTHRISTGSIGTHMNLDSTEVKPMVDMAVNLAKKAIMKYLHEVHDQKTSVEQYNFSSRPILAGCCGSYNATLFDNVFDTWKLTESLSLNYLSWFHQQRMQVLLNANVDLLTFESIPTLREVDAIITVLKLHPTARALITFLCTENGKLLDGSNFADVAVHCYNSLTNQIFAIGTEANNAIADWTLQVMKNINYNREDKIPFVLYVSQSQLHTMWGEDKFSLSQQHNYVQDWLDAGICCIGGGSNTVAQDIRMICKEVNNYCIYTNRAFASDKGSCPVYTRIQKNLSRL